MNFLRTLIADTKSDAEWCMVDDDFSSPSSNQAEPETEPEIDEVIPVCEPKTTAHVVEENNAEALPTSTSEDMHIEALLVDKNEVSSVCRDFSMSLLSPTHRRYALTGTIRTPGRTKRQLTSAFMVPSRRVYLGTSFPERLRAQMPSRRRTSESDCSTLSDSESISGSSSVSCGTMTETMDPVLPMVHEIGTQTMFNWNEPSPQDLFRLERLKCALARSFTLTQELQVQSQHVERLEMENRTLHCQLSEMVENPLRMQGMGRSMAAAFSRENEAKEQRDTFQAQVILLEAENAMLKSQMVMGSDVSTLGNKTINELEALEDALHRAIADVRNAIRAKHRPHSVVTPSVEWDFIQGQANCVGCQTTTACVRLEPCGHHVACSTCALEMDTCPMDQIMIQDKILTFGLNEFHCE